MIGAEDVLDGERPPAPVEPEPLDPRDRTRFRTGLDVLVVVLIVVVALVVGFLVWRNSSVRTTSSQVNQKPVTAPEGPTVFPPSLGEVWHASSPATPVPVAVGPVVLTGNGGEVAG